MVANRNMTIESCEICRRMRGRLELESMMMMMLMRLNIDLVLG